MKIKFKKLSPNATTPLKLIDIDAGFDLFATSMVETNSFVEYGTDISFEIPEGFVGLLFPRSSITKYDLMLKNSIGLIDASYRGEIRCRFFGTNNTYYSVGSQKTIIYSKNSYKVGDRIAQIVFMELPKIELEESEELSNTERGTGGFGHTGE